MSLPAPAPSSQILITRLTNEQEIIPIKTGLAEQRVTVGYFQSSELFNVVLRLKLKVHSGVICGIDGTLKHLLIERLLRLYEAIFWSVILAINNRNSRN